jgi:hypothetical protein
MGILPWSVGAILVSGCFAGLRQLRKSSSDDRDAMAAWAALARRPLALPASYDPRMVADLPEPARRFFDFAIEPGTPLRTVVEIAMAGQLSLGTKQARQRRRRSPFKSCPALPEPSSGGTSRRRAV